MKINSMPVAEETQAGASKMKAFNRALKEINSTLNSILLFGISLNTIIVFLIFYLIFLLIGVKQIYAIFPSFIYFIVLYYLKTKENKVRKVERKYRELDEKLRTAADNIYLQNPVVEELQKEVLREVRNVEVSSFLNTKRISSKIVITVVLCFLILFIASLNIKPFNYTFIEQQFRKVVLTYGNETGPIGPGDITIVSARPGAGEIYGNRSALSFGRREEELKLEITGYELNVRDVNEAEKQEFEELFPDEVFVSSASAYEENIPKEQQELVKNYFKKLAES